MPSAIPTRDKWFSMIRGHEPSADVDRCTTLVFAYHLKQASDTGERLALIEEMLELAHEHLAAHGPVGPSSGVIGLLQLSAAKEKHRIEQATRGWAVARKMFAPAGGPFGAARTVQHRFADSATPTSHGNYWLEVLDPRHRSWGHADPHIFDDWFNDATELNFWDWLENKGFAQNFPGVTYLAPDQRWQYQIFHHPDRRLYRHGPPSEHRSAAGGQPQLFSTRGMETLFGGPGYAIWVCSPDGTFYTASHKENHFHHSSFLAGERVLAAGEWVVADGTIQVITHKTGHYRATPQNLFHALLILARRTDLSHTAVALTDYGLGATRYVKATEFLERNGNGAACASVAEAGGGPAGNAPAAIRALDESAYVFVER